MSFAFVANLILILSLLGILVMFFRRIPEVVDQRSGQGTDTGTSEEFGNQALLKTVWQTIKLAVSEISEKIWHFMLEAKDLKQSQIIAAKFSRLVTPKAKLQNIGAYNNLKKAAQLTASSEFDEAEQLYIQVIRKHPQEYQAYEGLVKIYTAQKKNDNAIEVLEFLAHHNPDHDGYLAQLGGVLLTARRFEESAEAYRRSLAINDLVPARMVNLGLALQSADKREEALMHFQRAVDLEPANVQYLVIFADALSVANEIDRAISVIEKGITLLPNNKQLEEKLTELKHHM